MALLSNQILLFNVYFVNGSLGAGYYNIILDTNTNDIRVVDDNGNTLSFPQSGYPSPSIEGQYSNYSHATGTVYYRFVGLDINEFPFAEIEETEYTGYEPHSLRIKNPIKITPDDGSDSGMIEVETEGATGSLSYSLDPAEGTLQSNIFYDLPAGDYRLVVSDGASDQTLFVRVPAITQYNTIYAIDYKDRFGKRSVVYIKKKDYSGAVLEPKYTGNPIVLNYPGDDEKFHPVFGSELKLGLISESNYEFLNQFSSEFNDFLVEFIKDYSPKWYGKIITDNYSEAYQIPPYPVNIVAADGLAILKNIELADDFGQRWHGSYRLTSVICALLQKTGLNLDVWFSFPYSHSGMSSSWCPLHLMFIDVQYLYDKTDENPKIYDVLSDLLSSFNLRLYQNDGHFEIVYINQMSETITFHEYNYLGDFQYTTHVKNHVIYNDGAALYGSTSFVLVDNSALLKVLPAYKKTETIYEPGIKSIIGSDFNDVNVWKTSASLHNWKNTATINQIYNNDGKELALQLQGSQAFATTAEYLITSTQIESGNSVLKLNLTYKLNSPVTSETINGIIYIGLEIQTATDRYMFFNGAWRLNQIGYLKVYPEGINKKTEFEMPTGYIPASGQLNLYILQYIQPQSAQSDFVENIEIYKFNIEGVGTDITTEVEESIENGDYSKLSDVYEMMFADSPNYDFSKNLYKRILKDSSGNLLGSGWPDGDSLQKIINTDKSKCYNLPQHAINGSMVGPLDFSKVLYDQNNPGRYFLINRLRIDDKSQVSEVDFSQIETYEDTGGGGGQPENLTADSTNYTADDTTITADQTIE